ncbi:MAG: hypothetical protein J5654_09720 [Victivallales bacterium]|nr:hypothetical protein [Victivallales bacterium]
MEVRRLAEGTETWDQNNGSVECTEAEVPYLVLSPTSKADAVGAVIADAKTRTINGLPLKSVRVEEYSLEQMSCTAIYGMPGSEESEESEESGVVGGENGDTLMSVSVTTGTVHVTRAISQRRANGSPDNLDCMIGWNGLSGEKAEFAGVDIPIGQCSIQYKSRRMVQYMTAAFVKRCTDAGGKVNSASWKGFPAGSLMCQGCSYDILVDAKPTDIVTITWSFSFSPPGRDVINGHSISKKGWEYAWGVPSSLAKTEGDKIPYISKVVDEVNFAMLGL